MRRQLDALKAIHPDHPDKLKKQAIDWLEIIETQYGDLIRPQVFEHSFGQDAKALRFAIEHVTYIVDKAGKLHRTRVGPIDVSDIVKGLMIR